MALSVVAAGSATAAQAVVTSPGGIVADGALHRVFVGDHTSGKIVATDYNGTLVDSVSGVSGVSDLTLSADGTVLYAAAEGSHQIVALDAATLDVRTRYTVATDVGPRYVAFAGGKVWFTYGDQWSGNLGSVDPSAGTTAGTTTARSLAAAPADASTSDPAPTDTPTADPTPSGDPTPDPTDTPTADPSPSDTPTADPTPTDTPTADPTPSGDPTPDPTDTPTADPSPSDTPTADPSPTDTPTADPSPTDTPTPPPTPPPTGDPTPPPADPVTLGQFPGPWPGIWGPGILDTNPSEPGVLAIGETGISTDSMSVVDVSTGTPKSTAWYFGDYTLNSGIGDIDLVPGSTPQVLVNGTQRDGYAGGKFTAAGAYPAGQRADIAGNGLVAQASGTNVAVYKPNTTQPLHTYAVGGTGAAALTWAPDYSRIFALVGSGSSSGTGYTVKVLTDPTKNAPILTVTAPATATRGKALTVSGKLSVTVPVSSGATLQVVRVDLESPQGKALAAVHPKADGTFAFSDTPPAGGTVTYKVSYAGDAAHTAVSTSRNVAVSRTATALSVNNTGKMYNYNTKVTFTARLGATYKNRTVEIWADPYGGDKPNKLLRSGTVNSQGYISTTLQLVRDTAITVVYKGDARSAPRTVRGVAYTRVALSTSIARYYRTGKIGSTSYYWFHKSTDPYVTTVMTAYPGRAQRLDLQIYYAGTWYAAGSQYFRLSSTGKSIVAIGAPGQSGIRVRVKADYIDTASGDYVNTSTYGAWKYLYFTN
ncbi:YncE family protein [Actinacidiphila rubida]|uniref:YncE family protein n=1 Tax=Actinacidiphila rubida TaxID=310780 RepID=UPI00159EF8D0|nr:Ig-like domain repeat protein [Actinacidiphila rubida]